MIFKYTKLKGAIYLENTDEYEEYGGKLKLFLNLLAIKMYKKLIKKV